MPALLGCLLLYGASTWAGSSALAARCSNSEDSLLSLTYAKLDVTNVVIHPSELANGHRYLILYNAGLGATNAASEVAVRVMYGATEIAEAVYEADHEAAISGSNIDNGPRSAQGGALTGFYVLTANGSDSLFMEYKFSEIGGGCYISGKCLMTIDLSNLTNDTHYFDSVQNGSGVVIRDSSDATTDTTLLSDTYTTEAGDYLVLASGECWDSLNSSTTFSKQCYLMIDGTVQGPAGGGKHTWEDISDIWNWSYAKIHTFTAASHTFRIRIGNIDTPAAGVEVYGRRGRIILIKKSAYFDVQTRSHDGFISIANDYNTWATDTSLTYTNNTGTTENIVLIANGSVRGVDADDHGVVRLLNNTDAVAFSEVGTGNSREANDTIAVTSIGFISQLANAGSKQILYQASGDSTTNNQTLGFVRLIAWNLKENLSAPPPTTFKRRRREHSEVDSIIDFKAKEVPVILGLSCNCQEK